jgi:NADPH:quinone reductase-like Zn-dependent oxidoreductase
MTAVALEMPCDAKAPDPVPRRREVRVAAHAATVNRLLTA